MVKSEYEEVGLRRSRWEKGKYEIVGTVMVLRPRFATVSCLW